MARIIFGDTGFFIALFDPNDGARAQATTDWIYEIGCATIADIIR